MLTMALARIGIAVAAANAAAQAWWPARLRLPIPDHRRLLALTRHVGRHEAPMTGMSAMPMPAATSMDPVSPVAGTEVRIDNFAFVPLTLIIKRGETVTWTNQRRGTAHQAAGDGSFHRDGCQRYLQGFTFSTPGSFDYICPIHPFMRAPWW